MDRSLNAALAEPSRSSRAASPARFWAYVAVFGGLWGAAEVGLGSLLHALKVPYTGQILTCVGIVILSAQRRLVPLRGISVASGAVAAICKSVSPGGIIVSPMVGIFMEAASFEVALLPAPGSRALAALGGAFALWWTVAHGLVMQVVFLGTRVLDLYVQLLAKAGAFLGLRAVHGWTLLAAVAGLLAAIGIAASIVGSALGGAARARMATAPSGGGIAP